MQARALEPEDDSMRSADRYFAALFGALLLGTGIYAAFFGAVEPVWRFTGGLLLAVLGGNAIYGSLAGKRPWIFRIGPLP
jgi:hypothetical protein